VHWSGVHFVGRAPLFVLKNDTKLSCVFDKKKNVGSLLLLC
jgi:hypothetical protein